MPDDVKDTQGTGGGGGPGDGTPAGGTQTAAQSAEGAAAQAPQQSGTPPTVEALQAQVEAERKRRSDMQAEFDKSRTAAKEAEQLRQEAEAAKAALQKFESRFGPADQLDELLDSGSQSANAARRNMPGAQASPVDWQAWANQTFNAYCDEGHYREADMFAQEVERKGLADMGKGILNASQPQAQRVDTSQFLTRDDFQKALAEANQRGREFSRNMASLEESYGKDFFDAEFERDGSQVTRREAIRDYCDAHSVSPRAASLALFEGHLFERQKELAMRAAESELQRQRAATGVNATRRTPIPQTPPDQKAVEAWQRAGEESQMTTVERPDDAADMVIG